MLFRKSQLLKRKALLFTVQQLVLFALVILSNVYGAPTVCRTSPRNRKQYRVCSFIISLTWDTNPVTESQQWNAKWWHLLLTIRTNSGPVSRHDWKKVPFWFTRTLLETKPSLKHVQASTLLTSLASKYFQILSCPKVPPQPQSTDSNPKDVLKLLSGLSSSPAHVTYRSSHPEKASDSP